ncbi:MAG TPA: MBL fold metallo-hydrolase [Gemmatimonadaceae bacterium]|nr:MBL fold metallo-hydrolase [Gemmatimonadaceae bacterium]
MLLKRFYDDDLAQASYLVGCDVAGEAVVIDANRDVEQYIAAADAEGLRITHVTETHIHADFVSGSRQLAARAGARLLLSGEGGTDWQYGFAKTDGAVLLHDGDTFNVGRVRVDVRHTPGHTPEHLAFLVTDTATADRPMGAFTGDFIFVGDVGRPDLLERAAGWVGTMEASARTLYRSLQRFLELPDYLQLWPGHGAGSACGKALGAVPQSTLGYERLFNWALTTADEEEFVRMVLAGQPEPPRYFAEMKRINRDGPPVREHAERPGRLPAAQLPELLESGALIIDTRHRAAAAAGMIPGTISLPLGRSFNTWAGWLIPYDRDIYLIVDDDCDDCLERATRALSMIGLDAVAGYFGDEVIEAWTASGRELDIVPQMGVGDLAERRVQGGGAAPILVDVRGAAEWSAGHIPGAQHIPLGELLERAGELDRDAEVVLHCQGGGRASIGATLLKAHGFTNVSNLSGGFSEWKASGQQVETGEGEGTPPEHERAMAASREH